MGSAAVATVLGPAARVAALVASSAVAAALGSCLFLHVPLTVGRAAFQLAGVPRSSQHDVYAMALGGTVVWAAGAVYSAVASALRHHQNLQGLRLDLNEVRNNQRNNNLRPVGVRDGVAGGMAASSKRRSASLLPVGSGGLIKI